MGLRAKGETAKEIAGAAAALRDAMVRLRTDDDDGLVDTCGTGGGKVGRSTSPLRPHWFLRGWGEGGEARQPQLHTRCGSADVLEALGVDISISPERAAGVLRQTGFVFLFAPIYHPAMRHVGPIRKEFGILTIMNLLGPLANPAGVARQVIGVADDGQAWLVAEALVNLHARHALVIHAAVGMDEVSPSGLTHGGEIRDGEVTRWQVDPADYGLRCDDLDGLAGGEPAENAARLERLLAGQGREPERCAVLLNAAAALYVSGNRWSFGESVERAREALESGAGMRVWRGFENGVGHRRGALRMRPLRSASVLSDYPDDHSLNEHVPLLKAERLHGGVGRLESDPAAGLAVEFLDRGLTAVDQGDDHLPVFGALLAVHHDQSPSMMCSSIMDVPWTLSA